MAKKLTQKAAFPFPQMHVNISQGWHFPKGGKGGGPGQWDFITGSHSENVFFLFSFLLIFLTTSMTGSPSGSSRSSHFCNVC